MKCLAHSVLVGVIGVGVLITSPDSAAAQRAAAPRPDRFAAPDTAALQRKPLDRKYSMPIPLADFLPGLGTVDVDPTTLPEGPFVAYDNQGNLVSSIYMIPLGDLNSHKSFSDLKVARERADHVDILFNAGHPAVAEPHYHVILWYVSPQRASELATTELTR